MDNRTATLDVICCEVLNSPRRAVGKDFWKICMAYGSDLFGGSWWLWNHSCPTCCFSFSSSTWRTFGSLRKNYYLASLLYLREQSADWWFRHSFQVINASSASRHQLDHMITSDRSKTNCSRQNFGRNCEPCHCRFWNLFFFFCMWCVLRRAVGDHGDASDAVKETHAHRLHGHVVLVLGCLNSNRGLNTVMRFEWIHQAPTMQSAALHNSTGGAPAPDPSPHMRTERKTRAEEPDTATWLLTFFARLSKHNFSAETSIGCAKGERWPVDVSVVNAFPLNSGNLEPNGPVYSRH